MASKASKAKQGNDLIRKRILDDLINQSSREFQDYIARRGAGIQQAVAEAMPPAAVQAETNPSFMAVPGPSPGPPWAPPYYRPPQGTDVDVRQATHGDWGPPPIPMPQPGSPFGPNVTYEDGSVGQQRLPYPANVAPAPPVLMPNPRRIPWQDQLAQPPQEQRIQNLLSYLGIA